MQAIWRRNDLLDRVIWYKTRRAIKRIGRIDRPQLGQGVIHPLGLCETRHRPQFDGLREIR